MTLRPDRLVVLIRQVFSVDSIRQPFNTVRRNRGNVCITRLTFKCFPFVQRYHDLAVVTRSPVRNFRFPLVLPQLPLFDSAVSGYAGIDVTSAFFY